MKVCSPSYVKEGTRPRGCIEIEAPSGRTYDFRKGIADVSPSDAKAIVAYGGFLPSLSGTTRAHEGYRCSGCGFGSWFTKCSRCGGRCAKEING